MKDFSDLLLNFYINLSICLLCSITCTYIFCISFYTYFLRINYVQISFSIYTEIFMLSFSFVWIWYLRASIISNAAIKLCLKSYAISQKQTLKDIAREKEKEISIHDSKIGCKSIADRSFVHDRSFLHDRRVLHLNTHEDRIDYESVARGIAENHCVFVQRRPEKFATGVGKRQQTNQRQKVYLHNEPLINQSIREERNCEVKRRQE